MSQTRLVNVVTPLGDELLFLSMSGREALGAPFSYEVELLSESGKVDLGALLGQTISLELELEGGSVREFNGVVTFFSAVGGLGRYARYRLTMRPWLALLGNRRNCRIFQDKTVPDVVKEIFRDHGFSDFTELLAQSYEPRGYLVQYRESDLNFVNRILEEEGIYYFFQHKGGKTILVLADSYSAHEPAKGSESLPYFPPQQGEHRKRDHIDSWTVFRQIRSGKVELADFDFEKPAVKLRSNTVMPAEHPYGDAEIFDYPGRFTQRAAGDRLTRLQIEEHLTDQEVVSGTGNARAIFAGVLFSLEDFPREDQNKEYLIVDYSVELRDNSYESGQGQDSGTEYRCRFSAIESKRPYHPPRLTPKPVVEGPQTAVVVGQEGKEIWTDNYGRVKLKFHWDRKPEEDHTSSCWVRVAQLWAGNGFGGLHVPRIGQEVIVDFLEGDPDQPIVTGRVYNADNMPPYKLPDNATQSGIKSRSTLKGTPSNFNELRFEDKKGQEEVYMQAERNRTTLVKNDQSTTVQKNRSASIGANDSISVGGDRSVSVKGNLSVSVDGGGKSPIHSTLKVTGKHDITASDTIELTATTHIKLTCGGSSILIQPGQITIMAGGGAGVVLTGSVATSSAAGSQMTLDANAFTGSSGGSGMLLDANAAIKANSGAAVVLDANVLAESKMGAKVVLDANALMQANADVVLDGMNVAGKGKMQASLEVASSSCKISPAGAAVAGPTVNVNGTGMVSVAGPIIKIG